MRNVLKPVKSCLIALMLAICPLIHPAKAAAQSIDLAWDAPSDATVAGYRVHVGTQTGVYTQTFDVPVAQTTFTFSTGVPGTTYFFAVKSFNSSNVTSDFSNEVSAHINAPPVLAPIANRTAPAGTALSFDVAALASDPENDPLEYSATGLPAGLSIGTTSGLITGTPTATGTASVAVTVTDEPGATASRSFTWEITPQPLAFTALDADHPSPQAPGRLVTFTAAASGGTPPYAYKFRVQNTATGVWTVAREWGASSSFVWTAQAQGSYAIEVWGRSSGNTADSAEASRQLAFATDPALDVTAPQLQVTSHTNNQVLNTQAITLAGSASDFGFGGTGVTVLVNGVPATGGAAAGEATASWTHAMTLAPGVNAIALVARDGAGNQRETQLTLTAQVPLTAAFIAASLASPQAVGTPITLTASSTGGVAPIQYRWWVRLDSGPWTMTRDWGTGSYAWTPSTAGNYSIVVHARSAGATSDTPEATGFLGYTVLASMTPVTSAALAASLPSPQSPGTSISFVASSTGGLAPVEYRWYVRHDSGPWTMLRDWNANVNLTWTPDQPGSYSVIIHARSAGVTSDVAQASAGVFLSIIAPVTSAAVTSSVPSPQLTGTQILLTASSTGGAPAQYRWYAKLDAGAWVMLRDWSTTTSLLWVPSAAGVHNVIVHVRAAGSTSNTAQASAGVTFTITDPPPPVETASMIANVASPQVVGTPITLTAGSTGGRAPVQYRWWARHEAGAWIMLRDWHTSTTLVWTPSAAGLHNVIIHARSSGEASNASQASAGLTWVITEPPNPVTSAQVTTDRPSPQTVGTTITLTASSTGGVQPAEYRWWVRYGSGEWVLLRDWSTNTSISWTPSLAGLYNVIIHARSAGSIAGVEASAGQTFDIRP